MKTLLAFRNDTASEYKQDALDKTNPVYVRLHNLLGIAINIAVPAVLLFVFKLSLPQFLLAFIAFDILQVFGNFIFVKLFQGICGLAWLTKKFAYAKKVENMTPAEIEGFINNWRDDQAFSQEKLAMLKDRMEEYRSFASIKTPDSNRENIVFVAEMIEKLRNYHNIHWIDKSLDAIVEKSEAVLGIVKEDPDAMAAVINTYNIYAEELLSIVRQYEDMDERQKERYKGSVEKLIKAFYEHLENLEVRITKHKETNINRDIDFLMQKLQEEEAGMTSVSPVYSEEGDDA